jgi:hypothetical protein
MCEGAHVHEEERRISSDYVGNPTDEVTPT